MDANFAIANWSGSYQQFNRSPPQSVFAFHRLMQPENLCFRQNDPILRRGPPWFNHRRVTLDKRMQARHHFIERFVLALQSAQCHLRQVSRCEIRRANERQRIVYEFVAAQAAEAFRPAWLALAPQMVNAGTIPALQSPRPIGLIWRKRYV